MSLSIIDDYPNEDRSECEYNSCGLSVGFDLTARFSGDKVTLS